MKRELLKCGYCNKSLLRLSHRTKYHKECWIKAYRESPEYKEVRKAYTRKHYVKNRERICSEKRAFRKTPAFKNYNKDYMREYSRSEANKLYRKERYEANKERIKKINKKYYYDNREKILKKRKEERG